MLGPSFKDVRDDARSLVEPSWKNSKVFFLVWNFFIFRKRLRFLVWFFFLFFFIFFLPRPFLRVDPSERRMTAAVCFFFFFFFFKILSSFYFLCCLVSFSVRGHTVFFYFVFFFGNVVLIFCFFGFGFLFAGKNLRLCHQLIGAGDGKGRGRTDGTQTQSGRTNHSLARFVPSFT